jgi:hypothetical protein
MVNKIQYLILLLIVFSVNAVENKVQSSHWTEMIFSTPENQLIKLSDDNLCVNSSAENFNDIKPIKKFYSLSECNAFINKLKN